MSELLEQAIKRLRELPEDMQDIAARALIFRLDAELYAEHRNTD
jgi:hypothetical protein